MAELLPDNLVILLLSGRSVDGSIRWEFEPRELVRIGRGDDADVRLEHRKVSRFHAVISVQHGQWNCSAVGRNGTFVDGQAVSQFRVQDGNSVTLTRSGPCLQFQLNRVNDLSAPDNDPVTMWLVNLAAGDQEQTEKLFAECFERIVRMARTRLSPALKRVGDEEDIALSVFQSLCTGLNAGRFPDLSSRNNLWRLLTTMTARKVVDWAHQQQRLKRGGGQVRGESIFIDGGDADQQAGFDALSADDLAPHVALRLADRVEELLGMLDDEQRQIAMLKMNGFTNNEIADQLERNARTVQRRLQDIRTLWAAELGAELEF